jgi:uncharacterized protein
MNLTATQLAQIQHFFTDKPVKTAWVFGSFARGTASETSDIDLLVELDYSEPIGLSFIGMWLDLQDILGKKVDLISDGGVSPFVRPSIEHEKRLIYERSVG